MNTLGLLLAGGAVRAAVLAGLGAALVLGVRRRGPAAGALAALATLTGLVAVSALSLTPWPGVWTVTVDVGRRAESEAVRVAERVTTPAPPDAARPSSGDWTGASAFVREFVSALKNAQAVPEGTTTAERWGWPGWVAAGVLVVWAAGLARLGLALRAVQGLRRRGRAVDDPGVLAEVEALRADLALPRAVETRVCDDLATPATVGWLKPVVLLPPEWRGWGPAERRAVLAHELAHVRGADYAWGFWAQFCLALHVYNPLAHWLVARLRLDQELSADARGAALAGGNRPYLESLARLALRRAEAPPPWPARPFLPSRNAFLRRIEMLRDARTDTPRTGPTRVFRWAMIAAVAAATLGVAGLRAQPPGATEDDLRARQRQLSEQLKEIERLIEVRDRQKAGGARPAAGFDPFDLSRLPADAVFAVAGRPADVFARPGFRPLLDILMKNARNVPSIKVPPDQVDGFSAGLIKGEGFFVVLHADRPQDWKAVAGSFIGDPEEVNHAGKVYVRTRKSPVGAVYHTPDDRTIVTGSENAVIGYMVGGEGKARHAWDEAWVRLPHKGQLAFAADTAWLRETFNKAVQGGDPKAPLAGVAGAVGPLLESPVGYAAAVSIDQGLSLEMVANCPDDATAAAGARTLRALQTLVQNALKSYSNGRGGEVPGSPQAALRGVIALTSSLLDAAQIDREPEGHVVRLTSKTRMGAAAVAQSLLPLVTSARSAAGRARGMNNMKQILLAFHNFHSVNDHFPPAVGKGPDGRVPYSWRVAILPFLDQESLYKQYDFTEPWDSPKNLKVLAQMPAVYRDAGDDRPGHFTSYFVPTGPGTLFPPDGKGTAIQEVLDGASTTIALVEAKREVPWTKPEDIPVNTAYDAAPPEFGGFSPDGFTAGFADGSVRFLSRAINRVVLKALLTKAGGEVISSDALNPPDATKAPPAAPRR